jgi:signal transduction histidine kinase
MDHDRPHRDRRRREQSQVVGRRQRRDLLIDVGIVVGLLGLAVGKAFLPGGTERSDPLAIASMAVVIVPLLWRRRYPAPVMAVSGVLYFGRMFLGFPSAGSLDVAQLIAIYSVGAYERRPLADRARLIAGLAVTTAFLVAAASGFVSVAWVVSSMATWVAVAFFGEAVYVRGRYEEALEERARRAEEEQAERDRRAIADERARIAREFHDIWAHTLSVVVVQAEAAEEVFDASPAQAREALGRIRKAGREALAEVRRLIASDMTTSGSERLVTVPTLADLGALADDLRASGMPVTLAIGGSPDRIPADIQLSAYRIVQQALTNALTHGGPGVAARVDVRVSDDEVCIDVVDDGRAMKPEGRAVRQGRGLIGMRERVGLFGGSVEAGPEPGGGFGVHARVPLPST